jgi:predicted GTPase
LSTTLRRRWPETLLIVAVTLPWLALLALGTLWLWEHGHVLLWAIVAAVLALLAWPLTRTVRRRNNAETRAAIGDRAEPSRAWNTREREAWSAVVAIADATAPLSFVDVDPLLATARKVVEAAARQLHQETEAPWAQFSLPDVLLLTERVSQDLRREALRMIPGIRFIKLGHVLRVKQIVDHYGPIWTVGYNLWRIIRGVWNPTSAAAREISGVFDTKLATIFSDRVRARLTQEFVLEIGRAAIDLYSGRLALSEAELQVAQERDKAPVAAELAPVRILLLGQVNAGKSSLVNALAREIRCAIGPLPTTARVTEYQLDLGGGPGVSLVDMPGLGDGGQQQLRAQAERADLVLWVASATQPARSADRQALDYFRAWTREQLARRPPRVVLALTHIDELRPANQWAPPYDLTRSAEPKASNILAAIHSVGSTLDLPMNAIVPVAMPPDRKPYNIDALWARVAVDLDDARLVQLDRLRIGGQRLSLRELANQLGHAGRFVIEGIARADDRSGLGRGPLRRPDPSR